ncbi:MAG: maleylpyruvate isomerase N-terminal domain-containing protein [Pseudomonadota bacterium]
MTDALEEARAALRLRQGGGARYDAANAPARELDWARRGTAYFARLLNGLDDRQLDRPSALEGVSRRFLVAHVGYHARALSKIVGWARQRPEKTMPDPMLVDAESVERQSTQPARALRFLFAHTQVHLNVEWRDLTDTQWDLAVVDVEGRSLAVRSTAWLRARAVWLHALELDAGGRLIDAPADFVSCLTDQVADCADKQGSDDNLGQRSPANSAFPQVFWNL